MVTIEKEEKFIAMYGSANLTRRNVDDYNLETKVITKTSKDTILCNSMKIYFDRIWTNKGTYYTVHYENYKVDSFIKTLIYHF
ncbi:hypothetical protein HYG84_17735 (plasmid) [Alkaliphilus sp. B6464]|nr:hypothetical protein HYG84_17735 [Alkaliphilus sp. B6464]